jgi:hypothetical protein
MQVSITKEYQVTQTFDAPDGLTEQELLDWAAGKADEMFGMLSETDDYVATYVHNEDTDREIADW